MTNFFYDNNEIKSELIFGNCNENNNLCIVVPTYRRIELLKKTLISLINQKGPVSLQYQVFIVSNDPDFCVDDLDMELNPDIFCIFRNKENLGMVGNMNRCAMLARGDFVSFIQDDDVLLNTYLFEICKIYDSIISLNIGCLIPNRFYYFDKTSNGIFGRKSFYLSNIKSTIQRFIEPKVNRPLLKKIEYVDCAEIWYNCFGGGPTCGIIFEKKALMKSGGFDISFPYVFDEVMMFNFSKNNNVYLFDKYLAIYRMTDSASNRINVQEDFIRGDRYILENTIEVSSFVKKYQNEIIRFYIENKSKDVANNHKYEYNKSFIKYGLFRLVRFFKLMRSGLYRRETLPRKYERMI